jgi:DNA invertase Pin-like site-specific DNA recombinase
VFALEASRLARNNRDWHHLIDLCGMTETVLVDDDGVCDPHLINDRLLLGLKGRQPDDGRRHPFSVSRCPVD